MVSIIDHARNIIDYARNIFGDVFVTVNIELLQTFNTCYQIDSYPPNVLATKLPSELEIKLTSENFIRNIKR